MEFRRPDQNDVALAARLAVLEYKMETAKNPHLNPLPDLCALEDGLAEMFQTPYGLIALEQGRMAGFLTFLPPMKEQFGRVRGVFSPLHGSAFLGNNRAKTASLLFQQLAREMVKDNILSFALSKYAHDREVIGTFVLNGFGIRCSDGIRNLRHPLLTPLPTGIQCRELRPRESKEVEPLRRELERHLAESPIFLYSPPEPPSKKDRKKPRTFAAFCGDLPIAFLDITDDGETFISTSDNTLNICGAYCLPAYRGTGAMGSLVACACGLLRREGISYLGVDCETLNPNALYFWNKYFESYTYSFVRRIDERAVGGDQKSPQSGGRRYDDRIRDDRHLF